MTERFLASTARAGFGLAARASRLGLSCALALVACAGSDSHDLGITRQPAPSDVFYAEGDSFVGSWVGEAREPLAFGVGTSQASPAYVFPSGSSRIFLEIAGDPASLDPAALSGALTFGAGAAPPQPESGARGYPEGFNYEAFLGYDPAQGLRNYDGLPPLEGFPYEVESSTFNAGVPDGVLRLTYEPMSYLEPWCTLQAPHEQPDGSFGALPFAEGGIELMADGTNRPCSAFGPDDLSACPADMAELPLAEYRATYRSCMQSGPVVYQMSCDRMFLTRFCSCTGTRCGAEVENAAKLLLRIAGNTLIGVFDGATFLNARGLATPIGEVRFRRVSD